MDLYLIRHADAVSRSDPNFTEEDRPLTDKGRDQARALAEALQAHNVQFSAVVSSPLVRARQTAEQMLQHMPGPLAELQFSDHLAPRGKFKKLRRYLLGLGADSVALIGHEPDLSALAARFMGSRKAQLELAKAGVAKLRCDGLPDKGCAALVWLLTTEWMDCHKNGQA